MPATPPQERLRQIELARHAVMAEGRPLTEAFVDAWHDRAWIERSWRRCLARGAQPRQRVAFDAVPAPVRRRVEEASHALVAAARPVLDRLCHAIAGTHYFAILTDANGVVVDVGGAIDRRDPRAAAIARVGVDLSEASVGTSAIGAALCEQHPVWLHRGEHFFDDTSAYSCAGAPLFGPQGRCVGMLDLTGIDAAERPELKHLAAQAAQGIENALVLGRPHRLLLRLNWPGRALGDEADGLLCLDGDGWIVAANRPAREMLPGLDGAAPLHCGDLLALPWEQLFDLGRRGACAPLEVPLWSGLRLCVRPETAGAPAPAQALPLRDVEAALIRQAVAQARGNVMQAARSLGISRATVYRKLARK
jgi:sigma-54 dependent transcriptional regulator, acetoin dehydrogenase operon transcriptional activator AcoR